MHTFGLIISHMIIDLLSVIAIGTLFIRFSEKKTMFIAQSYCLVLIFKCYLKAYIGMPLSEWMMLLGWSIPSGHTIAYGTVYGLILDPRKQLLQFLVVILLTGSALVYCGYHQPIDILVASMFLFLILTFLRAIMEFDILSRLAIACVISYWSMHQGILSNTNVQWFYFKWMIIAYGVEYFLQRIGFYDPNQFKWVQRLRVYSL